MLKSSSHKRRIKTSFLSLLGCFIILAIPIYSLGTLQAKQKSSSLDSQQFEETSPLSLENGHDLQVQLVTITSEVVDALAIMEESLAQGQKVQKELNTLKKLRKQITRLDRQIVQDYVKVQQHCEENGLDSIVYERINVALDNYNATYGIIFDAIGSVLDPNKQFDMTLFDRIVQSREVLEGLQLKAEPDLDNSRPTVWQVMSAEEIPQASFDPNLPAVNVMAAAAAEPPVLADLLESIDVQITDEIIAEANELGNSALAIYEYIRNQFEFQPYYGSRKGSVETLRQRCGNDYDLASLLIAMLRSSGIEARYATGTVEIPVDRVTSWLGVDDGDVAGSILLSNGLEGISIIGGNNEVVSVRCKKVWVEVLVSRGRGGKAWVPLDPSFNQHTIHSGVDIPEEMALDAQTFIDEYYDPTDPLVTLPRPETPVELLISDVNDYIAVNYPDETVESVKRKQSIIPENLGLLPASLPYKVLSRDSSFSEIPADKVYQVRFHLYNGGTTMINETFDLPEIASKRITISYEGATQADRDIIDSYEGLLNTPPYLVNVRPVLQVAGQVVATGSSSIGAGRTHDSDIHFLAPTNGSGWPQNMVPAIYNTIIAGEYQAICLGVHGTTNPYANPQDPNDTEGFMAQLRYATGMGYLSACSNADEELGQLMHCFVTSDVSDAILQDQISVFTDMGGNPQSWQWDGLTVDADRKVVGIWKVDEYLSGCGNEKMDLMIIGGAEGSLYENRIFEDSAEKEAVSTIKILQLAADQGIPIYKRWNSLPLPSNSLSTSVRNAISSSISAGRAVTFPADEITYHNWTGTGYIDMDDCSGAAGYIISGGQNGGSTVVTWTDWLFVWGKGAIDYIEGKITTPAQDSPDPGALYAKTGFWYGLNPSMYFRYQLRPVFGDGSTGNWTYYVSPWYANFQFEFLPPGHYLVRVGDDGPDHERKVSIFDVEIRGFNDNAPPEYLPVKPDSGSAMKETYEAKVTPDDLNGDFSWSGSSKLKIISPTAKTTDIEANSTIPSGALKTENLSVVFRPTNATIADTSPSHMMTVYDVEITAEDGSSAPPKYIAVDKNEEIKGILKPLGVNGKFENWATSSSKVTLSYPAWGWFGKDVVEVKAGSNPSAAVDNEEIKARFKPEKATLIHEFEPYKMTVFKIDFDKPDTVTWGYDKYKTGLAAPKYDFISVEKNATTTAKLLKCTPTGASPDLVLVSRNESIADLSINPLAISNLPHSFTINGKDQDKATTYIDVKYPDEFGNIVNSLGVSVYKEAIINQVFCYLVEDSVSGCATPTTSITNGGLNSFIKQAVISITNVNTSNMDIRFDLNNNKILDYYNDGSNPEVAAITSSSFTGSPGLVLISVPFRDNWRLASQANSGQNTIVLVDASGIAINDTYFIGPPSGPGEMVTVTQINGNTITVRNNLNSNHPTTHTFYGGLGGLSTNPVIVTEHNNSYVLDTVAHEFLHTNVFGHLLDVGENDNLMYYSLGSGNTHDAFLRYREQTVVRTGTPNPTGSKQKQWDKVAR